MFNGLYHQSSTYLTALNSHYSHVVQVSFCILISFFLAHSPGLRPVLLRRITLSIHVLKPRLIIMTSMNPTFYR